MTHDSNAQNSQLATDKPCPDNQSATNQSLNKQPLTNQPVNNQPPHWQILAECAQGVAHIATDTPCQDYFCAQAHIADNDQPDNPNLIIFVADGAGSAKYAEAGAILSCEVALLFAQNALVQGLPLNHDFAIKCVAQVVRALETQVQKQGQKLVKALSEKQINEYQPLETPAAKAIPDQALFQHSVSATASASVMATADSLKLPYKLPTIHDYACTFLGVIVTPSETLLMQIGDGAIVIGFAPQTDAAPTLALPIAPMQGEYTNMTHFITEADALENLQTKHYRKPLYQAAVLTDGLQRLALDLTHNTPHQAFFTPFFKQLVALKGADNSSQALHKALSQFMQSEAVNSRTDDDKTLVLAQWHG